MPYYVEPPTHTTILELRLVALCQAQARFRLVHSYVKVAGIDLESVAVINRLAGI